MSDYQHPSELLPGLGGQRLGRVATLLDIGGGTGIVGEAGWKQLGVERFTVVDPWEDYANGVWWRGRPDVELVTLRGVDAYAMFGGDSFDVVQCCEAIEHMPKEEGHQLLEDAKRMARMVLLTCPNGFTVQDPAISPQEAWSANPYQLHVCGWSAAEFWEHGYVVQGNPRLEPGCQLIAHWVRP